MTYSDRADISDYAVETMGIAQAIGLIDGYPDGTIKPRGVLTRAEGTTIVLRLADYMEKKQSRAGYAGRRTANIKSR